MSRLRVLLCVLPLLLALAAPAAAQDAPAPATAPAPLEPFIERVAELWSDGGAAALMELASASGQLVLDTGSGTETVQARHAAAALRALFAEREGVSVRPVRVSGAAGVPPRGFGELAWSFRSRSAPIAQTRSVYVGLVWEAGGWRISELRVLP